MAYKALIFGTDAGYKKLKPFYDQQVELGNLEIVATAELQKDSVNLVYADGRPGGRVFDTSIFDLAIISSRNDFYSRMKLLESKGFSRNKIIDGYAFTISNLDFMRFISEGIVYASLKNGMYAGVSDSSYNIYRKVFSNRNIKLKLGIKSYLSSAKIGRIGLISVGNFSALAWNLVFGLGFNWDHNHRNVGQYGLTHFDWGYPRVC